MGAAGLPKTLKDSTILIPNSFTSKLFSRKQLDIVYTKNLEEKFCHVKSEYCELLMVIFLNRIYDIEKKMHLRRNFDQNFLKISTNANDAK